MNNAGRTLTIAVSNGTISFTSAVTLTVAATASVSGTNTGDQTSVTGNAGTVTTNANLTGPVTSVGNATTIAANVVTDAMLRQSAALSVVGRSANSTGNVADIAAASDGQVMRRSGTAVGFGSVDLASANAVTGTLPTGNLPTATQAEMETGTSTVRVVTPGGVKHAAGVGKALVTFTMATVGGAITIVRSENVTSVTRNAAGDFTVNFTTSFSGTDYHVTGMTSVDVGGTIILGVLYSGLTAPATGSCRVVCINFATGTGADPKRATFVFHGDQ